MAEKTKEYRQRRNESQRQYAERLKAAGLQRMCIWVPRDEALKERIRDFADQESDKVLDQS